LRAHNGYITSIKDCPINSQTGVLFATGSYDGYVKIWSTTELNSIYDEEVSNRKIVSLEWDAGAKFILALVDDQNDGCILVSLYSALKVDSHMKLLPASELRYIKELTHYNVQNGIT
jgi:WD40 repeat protein